MNLAKTSKPGIENISSLILNHYHLMGITFILKDSSAGIFVAFHWILFLHGGYLKLTKSKFNDQWIGQYCTQNYLTTRRVRNSYPGAPTWWLYDDLY